MPFELIKDIPEPYIEDKDRNITMKKKSSYGRRFTIFELEVNKDNLEFEVESTVAEDGTYWNVFKVSWPHTYSDEQKVQTTEILKECMEAFKELRLSRVKETQFISYSIN